MKNLLCVLALLLTIAIPRTSYAIWTIEVLDKQTRETKTYQLQSDIEFVVPIPLKDIRCTSPVEQGKYDEGRVYFTKELQCFYGTTGYVWIVAVRQVGDIASMPVAFSVGRGAKEYFIYMQYK